MLRQLAFKMWRTKTHLLWTISTEAAVSAVYYFVKLIKKCFIFFNNVNNKKLHTHSENAQCCHTLIHKTWQKVRNSPANYNSEFPRKSPLHAIRHFVTFFIIYTLFADSKYKQTHMQKGWTATLTLTLLLLAPTFLKPKFCWRTSALTSGSEGVTRTTLLFFSSGCLFGTCPFCRMLA